MHFDDAVTVNGCRSVGYAWHMSRQSRHAWVRDWVDHSTNHRLGSLDWTRLINSTPAHCNSPRRLQELWWC